VTISVECIRRGLNLKEAVFRGLTLTVPTAKGDRHVQFPSHIFNSQCLRAVISPVILHYPLGWR